MSTAEPLPDNIRRIAVLVSSVDSATSRQLLLHLPTQVAKQVRSALQNLGPVSPRERQRILAEFQSTASKQSAAMNVNAVASQPTVRASSSLSNAGFAGGTSSSGSAYQAPLVSHLSSPPLAQHSEYASHAAHSHAEQIDSSGFADSASSAQAAWARMDIRALSHFLRSERSTVIAVVLNQLSPITGVALLQQLPASMHREVLQAIANLQDIDSEAMQAIEEHLSERLKDYELQVSSESKGTRRVAALLAAAPAELQETWSRFVHIAVDPADEVVAEPAVQKQVATPQPTDFITDRATRLEAALGSHVVTTADASFSTRSVALAPPTRANEEDEAYILPFPKPNESKPLSDFDRSLIQLEFEQILSLSTQQLAQVLTAANSHTVLLALAGATPSFMKRFYSMLNKSDAKALASRLSQIGPLKLRDIDEAQRTISELAATQASPHKSKPRPTNSQSLRVAA